MNDLHQGTEFNPQDPSVTHGTGINAMAFEGKPDGVTPGNVVGVAVQLWGVGQFKHAFVALDRAQTEHLIFLLTEAHKDAWPS